LKQSLTSIGIDIIILDMDNTKTTTTATGKALRFKGYSRTEQTEGFAVIASGHEVKKGADWNRLAGNTVWFSCSCGFFAGACDNAQDIQEHANAVAPAKFATWFALQPAEWEKTLTNAKRQFKVAAERYTSVRRRADFIYVINGRSAYAQTAKEFESCATYLVFAARQAFRAVTTR